MRRTIKAKIAIEPKMMSSMMAHQARATTKSVALSRTSRKRKDDVHMTLIATKGRGYLSRDVTYCRKRQRAKRGFSLPTFPSLTAAGDGGRLNPIGWRRSGVMVKGMSSLL